MLASEVASRHALQPRLGSKTRPAAVLDWLLDSDPAIRWQVLRDLGGAPAEIVGAERDWVATEGLVASILSDIQVKVIALRPRATWAPYFEELLSVSGDRETRVSRAMPTQVVQVRFSYRLAGVA